MGGNGKVFLPEWAKNQSPLSSTQGGAPVFIPEWLKEYAPQQTGALLSSGDTRGGITSPPVILKGGNCIIPNKGIFPLDLYLAGGKIAALGKGFNEEGCEVINASGKYIIPGVVDPHTHIGIFAPFEEEIFSETRSALLNGVTTLGVYLGSQGSYLDILDRTLELIARKSCTDIFLHLPIFNELQLKEIPLYASRYGIKSFKAYMCGIPGMIPSLDEGFLLDLMQSVADLGEGAVLNIHAENYHIVEWATKRWEQEHKEGISLEQWKETHPGFSEAEAIQRAIMLSLQSGVKIYFVHVSAKESLEIIRDQRIKGRRFFCETTSPYLSINTETEMKALAKMTPPIGREEDRKNLWKAIAEDLIDTIGTDHTPLTKAEKNPTEKLWDTMPGYPAVGTHLPFLLDSARRYGITVEKLVEKISLAPSKLFGIYPKKGTLLPGTDADLVIVDLYREEKVTAERSASRSDFALKGGENLIGWPVLVLKKGMPVTRERIALGQLPPSSYLSR